MLDIFMIIMTIILSLLLLIISIWMLAYYGHPDDRWDCFAAFCKIIMIIGMTLAWAQVLMLPLDVANSRGLGGGINMAMFWQIVYITLVIMVVIIIPSCIYYYESDEDWSCWEKFKYAFCYLLATIIVCVLILVITYAFLSKAYIPIYATNCTVEGYTNSNDINLPTSSCTIKKTSFEINVSFPIYTIGLFSWVSWFLFVLFGGIGLAALPLDFFYDFHTRPIKMTKRELNDRKKALIKESQKTKELGILVRSLEEKGVNNKTFFNKEKRNYNNLLRQFRAAVCVIDNEYQLIEIQNDLNDKSVLLYWLGLPIGFICLLLSLSWFLHILLYFIIIPYGMPIYPFLNILLLYLVENNVSFLATGFFALFCLYLLFAAIKGNVKFGLRIMFCWPVHPMKKDQTYINSFLFNIMLILICSVSITQFCAASFKDYAVMTDIDLIFSTQIRYLMFFKYFFQYHVFEYALFGITIISTIYLLCRPSDKNSVEKMLAKRSKNKLENEELQNISTDQVKYKE